IGEEGESVSVEAPAAARAPQPAVAEADTSGARHRDEPSTAPPPTNGGHGRIKASPLARRIARERGISLEGLRGTGREGRIIAEDVERGEARPIQTRPVPGEVTEVERVPLTKIRATIARRLTEAWEVPVFQLTVSADMTDANALLARARELNPD